jgi:hypothetical protein
MKKPKLIKENIVEDIAREAVRLSPDKIDYSHNLFNRGQRTTIEIIRLSNVLYGRSVDEIVSIRPWRLMSIGLLQGLLDHFLIQPRTK